jgi:uncharacterized protein (TIGR02444 family)
MIDDPADELWRYSLALYTAPRVAEACLVLQDRRDADVNVLLLCCWAGSRGIALSDAALGDAVAAAAPWQTTVVRPLRAARRATKGWGGPLAAEIEAFREGLKAWELEAERLEQRMLAAAVPETGYASRGEAVARNLDAYLHLLGDDADGRDREALDSLVAAALRLGDL